MYIVVMKIQRTCVVKKSIEFDSIYYLLYDIYMQNKQQERSYFGETNKNKLAICKK